MLIFFKMQHKSSEKNKVNEIIRRSTFIQNLIWIQINYRRFGQEFLNQSDIQLLEDWMFLVQNNVAYVYWTRTRFSEFLFQLEKSIFDLILEIWWQFSLSANKLRIINVCACILDSQIKAIYRLIHQWSSRFLKTVFALCFILQIHVSAINMTWIIYHLRQFSFCDECFA